MYSIMHSTLAHRDSADSLERACRATEMTHPPRLTGAVIPVFEQDICSAPALDDVLQHRFTFNGEDHCLGSDIAWLKNPSRDIEWHILLHKFYVAPGLARRHAESGDIRYRNCFERLVRGWITQTPPGFIATDVTARRVQNWIYAWYLFDQDKSQAFSAEFSDIFFQSLGEQVDYICDNLAAKRNHRTLGLYAIFLAAAALPDLDRDGRWRRFSIEEMAQNIRSDILPDGVHCELSTDYHHIVLRSYLLFLRLARLNDIPLPAGISEKLCRALDFAMHIHRPDGEIPALSDSDSQSYRELLSWGADLFGREDYRYVATAGHFGSPPASNHAVFSDGGYVILRSAWQDNDPYANARYLVFDCGPMGAGNHGHIDALNIEVAAYGRPLIVDPGRFTYDEQGDINWRARFRKTAAHNTITVDDRDQAIYRRRGARFKILQPHPVCVLASAELANDFSHVHAFVWSPNYDAVHHRHIWFVDSRYWVILDRIEANDAHSYKLRYQLTPPALNNLGWTDHEAGCEVRSPGLTLLFAMPSSSICEEDSFVSSKYGIKRPAPRICASASGDEQSFLTVLYPDSGIAAKSRIHFLDGRREIMLENETRRDTWRWDSAKRALTCRLDDVSRQWTFFPDNHRG